MRTLKITVAYDGTRFVGWQRQAAGESVQGRLEEALAHFEGAPVTVHGAGRTDAGVHALAQVASVRLTCGHPPDTLVRGLNARLPSDVRVTCVEEAAPDFHARFSARSKTYRYLLRNTGVANPFDRSYVWHVPGPLDLEAMRAAAAALAGTHDFAAFRSTGSDTAWSVRTITRSELVAVAEPPLFPLVGRARSGQREEGRPAPGGASNGAAWASPTPARSVDRSEAALIAYEIAGNGFLRHMVRAIVGTLVEVGRGRRAPDEMQALLAGGARAEAGATAPAHGLFLIQVDYD